MPDRTISSIKSFCHTPESVGSPDSPNGRPWSAEELETLEESMEKGLSYKEISSALPGRSWSAVYSACRRYFGEMSKSEQNRVKSKPEAEVTISERDDEHKGDSGS